MYAKAEESKCPKLKRILSDMETEKLSYPSLEEGILLRLIIIVKLTMKIVDIEDFYYVRIIAEMLAPKAATCIQVTFPVSFVPYTSYHQQAHCFVDMPVCISCTYFSNSLQIQWSNFSYAG